MFRKKISLLVSCFLSFWTFSQVPDYFPVGAVWHEVYREETGGDMSSVCGSVSSYNLSVEEEVVLGSKIYTRIHQNGLLISHYSLALPPNPSSSGCNFTTEIHHDYYVRQDSLKIYVYLSDTTEHLLYDYDLNVGDTFHFSGLYPSSVNSNYTMNAVQCVVDSIGSMPVDGSFRKVFYLSHDNYGGMSGIDDTNSVFMEGIGNLGGFFCGISRFSEFTYRTLQCFGINNIPYWTGADGFCDLSVGLKNSENKSLLEVYPNPVLDEIHVQLPENFDINKIEIVDLLGQNNDVNATFNQKNDVTIDLSQYHSGIYFLKLTDVFLKVFKLKIIKL